MNAFCTLFDHHFLPQGLALHTSLRRHCPEFQLFVICVGDQVHQHLEALDLENVRLLRLADVETAELGRLRAERSHGEYCWTLASHSFSFVHAAAPEVRQLTYLDADLFFFDSPEPFFEELAASGKDILITEHAFAPRYARRADDVGRFCVQYLTVTFSPAAERVLSRWQAQCRQWCGSDTATGQFGDQKYLDEWPQRYPDCVHVLEDIERTLAPWNVQHVQDTNGDLQPVFYHFHGFRFIATHRARAYHGYRIGAECWPLYEAYAAALRSGLDRMRRLQIPFTPCPPAAAQRQWLEPLRKFKRRYISRVTRCIDF